MMAHTIGRFLIVAGFACAAQAVVAQTPAALQTADVESVPDFESALDMIEAMKSAPLSPNGRPMEAIWDRVPEAPDVNSEDASPYYVSRWGGIVIRGKRNGELIDRALAARHCGASDNPATDIYFIGEAPPNICEGVTVVATNQTLSFSSPVTIKGRNSQYVKMGAPNGWVVREFMQKIDDVTSSGRAPATGDAASDWGVSSLGAFYRNEDGKHVFYAPGETVKLYDDFSFVVEPVMDDDELVARAEAAIMNSFAATKTPWQWAFLLVFGIPLALIGGVIYGLVRFIRRRRGGVPAMAGRPLDPATIPVGMSHADAADAVRVSAAARAPIGEVKAVDQAEEFFGPSRTSANFRRRGWFTLLFLAGPGLFFFSMLWWGEPTVVANFMEVLIHFVVAKLLPLGLIALGVAGAVLNFRLGGKPEVETLWYRLDHAGLHILHDHLGPAAQTEIVQTPGGAGALIAWAAMKSLVVAPGASPRVNIVRRAPGAVIDRTLTLASGQLSRDGALFEDRLSLWFAEKSAAAAATPTMTGALPPTPREALQEIKDVSALP